jgi:dTDP-4-amino-4,6-dideoxygalactose transaminase
MNAIARKLCFDDLAISGGPPAFHESLHVGRPNTGERHRLLTRINDILDQRWFTNDGPYVRHFEQRIAELIGVKHCIAMCNGTIALEIAARAAGLAGEVIVPSFTFVATAHALQWQEITPVFCDIDPLTYNIDPCKIEEMITPRTTGIIGVHLWGRPCAVDTLAEIADRRKLILMFDAAHAFGCSYKRRMIGGFGLAEVFSFHATKFLNSFEGGAVTTNDDALAAKMRLMKNFGFAGYDNVIYIGTNGKMTEVCAAMGLTNLESLDELVAANRRNYHGYRQGLAGIGAVSLIEYDESERCNFQYIALTVDEQKAGLSRDELIQVFHAENVLARRYFYPGAHRMEPYRSFFPHAGMLLPVSEHMANRVLLLPTGSAIVPDHIRTICSILRIALDNPGAVRQQLSRPLRQESPDGSI